MTALALVAALVGCAGVASSPPATAELTTSPSAADGGPADPDAELRPDLMVATPATVAAGSTLELRFPQSTVRGIGFMLERPVDGAWVLAYQLLAAQPGEQPSWAEADAEILIAAIGILGPGPDLVAGARFGTARRLSAVHRPGVDICLHPD